MSSGSYLGLGRSDPGAHQERCCPHWVDLLLRMTVVRSIAHRRAHAARAGVYHAAMTSRRALGDFGERVAAAHLCATGQTYGHSGGVDEPVRAAAPPCPAAAR